MTSTHATNSTMRYSTLAIAAVVLISCQETPVTPSAKGSMATDNAVPMRQVRLSDEQIATHRVGSLAAEEEWEIRAALEATEPQNRAALTRILRSGVPIFQSNAAIAAHVERLNVIRALDRAASFVENGRAGAAGSRLRVTVAVAPTELGQDVTALLIRYPQGRKTVVLLRPAASAEDLARALAALQQLRATTGDLVTHVQRIQLPKGPAARNPLAFKRYQKYIDRLGGAPTSTVDGVGDSRAITLTLMPAAQTVGRR